jgi:pyrophosphate--fructose-6-phosphate 1-phosphotransferase
MDYSPLQKERYKYQPKLPALLTNPIHTLVATKGALTAPEIDADKIKSLFPHTCGLPRVSFTVSDTPVAHKVINIGVILSGGQAPGGHNVISGLYDAIKKGNSESNLIGFLGGPSGILENQTLTFTDSIIDSYRNTGGFDIIGSGRTKL